MELQRLTKKQREIFNIVIDIKNNKDKIPSLQDIADIYGCTRQAVRDHLILLQKKQYLMHRYGKFLPTSDGIEQFMLDTHRPERLKLTHRYGE